MTLGNSAPRIAQHRDYFKPGRSPVHGTHGMVATSHPLAGAAALDVLRRGGNAVDAAVAAVAVLCVVEQSQTGIGGDCFWLLAPGSGGGVLSYNGSGTAPQAATVERLRGLGLTAMPATSPHSVTVPGAIDGWDHIVRHHGTRPLADLLAYAIDYAENGFPLQARIAKDVEGSGAKMAADKTLASVFMPGGQVPAPGTPLKNPALARSLRLIAEQGRAAVYGGSIGRSLAAFLASKGGLHTPEDFARHTGKPTTPAHARFAGHDVYECPPNGQGIIALLMLRLLEHLGPVPEGPGSGQRVHQMMEVARIAYACRDAWLADPDQTGDGPWKAFLDDRWTRPQAADIRPDARVTLSGRADLPVHADTTYLCVVDRQRNAVSFINSLFDGFGSGLMDPETGILLHNRGQSFRLDPDHPNAIAPGKRPMHTIIPGMLLKDGRAVMPFGVMGGHFQPVGHAMLLANLFHYGMDLQQAIDFPRIYPMGDTIHIEPTFAPETLDHLRALGHPIEIRAEPVGGGQAIWIDHATGVLTGGSEPRKDGFALGF